MAADLSRPGFEDARFREVLSHYPTGVAVVTAHSDAGHLGMVVGSFTSVSLQPPLVAFLADHNSRTYGQLKGVRHFTINILAADQEHVCRTFASRSVADKWADVAWEDGADGVRKLAGAVAHIECSHFATHAAGDHDIVLGQVNHLATENPVLPLLFFQGGYGKFVPQSLVIPSQVDVAAPLRIIDVARSHMEMLAKELGAECVAQAKVNDELVFLASSHGGEDGHTVPRVGRRVPHLPPLGALYVAWEPEAVVDRWLNGVAAGLSPVDQESFRVGLERVRRRGYSVALEAEDYGPLERVVDRFTNGQSTPAEERFLRANALHLIKHYEPAEIPEAGTARVRVISAPVFTAERDVGLVLQVWRPAVTQERTLSHVAQRLLQVTRQVEEQIGIARAS